MADSGGGSRTGLFEPLMPPAFPVTPGNEGAYALLAAEIMIVISGLAVFVKLHIAVSTFRKLRWNDIALIVALAFAVGYTISIAEAVRNGLGSVASGLRNQDIRRLGQYYLASNILLFLSLSAAKCSIALLIIDIQPTRWIKLTLCGVLGAVFAWTIAAVVTVALQCGPAHWVLGPTQSDTCIDQYRAQVALRVIDMVTDVALSVLPGVMMMSVQVSKSKRALVSLMFGMRLATPALTIVVLSTLRTFYNADTAARPHRAVVPSIWTSLALNVSLITACLPSIKRFLNDWAAGVTRNALAEPFELQRSTDRSRSGQTYALRSFRKTRPKSYDNSRGDNDPNGPYISHARGSKSGGAVAGDDGDSSKGLTDGIMQTIDYHIEYEQDHVRSTSSPSSEGRRRVVHS